MRFFILFLFVFSFSFGQEEEILFSVNDNNITVKEFKRVYNKNIDLVKDEKQKDIDEYLRLYINYKLKLEEAYSLGLDKEKKYLRELQSYRNQLSKKYLTDSEVSEKLLKEAYQRTINEVNVNHILVRIDEDATPSDTLKVYNQLLDYRSKALKEGFSKVMKEVNDGKTIYGEQLGYFNAFRMVYPFETASYNTSIGDISMPFKTRFGYHIVNVLDKRKSQGEVTVAHIMIANDNKKITGTPKERIHELYNQLQEGAKFEDLARQFSDDKNSAKNGGKLTRFGAGKLNAKKFEDVAFSLTEEDKLSKPIQTKYGWHIIKLIKKHDLPAYEDMKSELDRKIAKDSRSQFINDKFYSTLKKRYNYEYSNGAEEQISKVVNQNFFNGLYDKNNNDYKKVLATFGNKKVLFLDYYNYLRPRLRKYKNLTNPTKVIKQSLSDFSNEAVYNYHKDNLENEYEEFANVMQEYKEGLLLFDLMEKQIWQKSKSDTIALKEFYNKNKANYFWKNRVKATIVSAKTKKVAKLASNLLKGGVTTDKLKQELNGKALISNGVFEENDKELPDNFQLVKGISKIVKKNGQYIVVDVIDVLNQSQKEYNEVKGRVINDYQQELEKQWLIDLKNKYPVKINNSTLDKTKKDLVK